ncbi:similar to RIKEN cDNA 1500031M22 (predicted), isoform CRA_b [Rattus norvegicus]|uniref:Similar to RIKEN cDNA 1500031M22 (Predicted), isoform CRA_b n=1 Tax=Rattus norvegicus TaxID=10116 RepID=A6I5H8_RAT|nr:similar to RIKEN cDNA 1500031M22 (predicted), isoform CRA_b [Rattus norvegicus]
MQKRRKNQLLCGKSHFLKGDRIYNFKFRGILEGFVNQTACIIIYLIPLSNESFFFFFFFWSWGPNPGPCACQASTLPLS